MFVFLHPSYSFLRLQLVSYFRKDKIILDPFLIDDFSRLAPLINNKFKCCSNSGNRQDINVMAEQRSKNHDASAKTSHSYASNCDVSNVSSMLVPKEQQRRHKESIVNYVQFTNFEVGSPIWKPIQHCNYSNLTLGNMSAGVLQSNSTATHFYRPNHESCLVRQSNYNKDQTQNINGFRFWEKVSKTMEPGFIFTVMSYNILAQDLVDQHMYLYTSHSREALKWSTRWNNLISEIRNFEPDILCLQEVQESHLLQYFSTLEQLGYRKLYKKRTGKRTDGCAIYYKHTVVALIEYTTVEYKQPNVTVLDRDNVAVIAKFSPIKNPFKEFVVANTHLLYNPRRQDVKLAQIQLLLAEIDRMAFKPRTQYLPVILTGDLNSTPESAVYKFITRGKLKYENLSRRSLQSGVNGPVTGKMFLPPFLQITDQCQHAGLLPKRQNNTRISRIEELQIIELKHSERQCTGNNTQKEAKTDKQLFASGTLSHHFSLKSVYQHYSKDDVEGTTFQDEWISVDYIFYTEQSTNLDGLTLLERYRIPRRSELGTTKIPNSTLGSDHLSLLAKFRLSV